jgi:hypothetical protein
MPKTSNLRSELLDIQQASDKSFVISVAVWDAPGSKDSPHAIRFQFVTHRNPALWWRLSMTTARQEGAGRAPARYTNAQYNKALRAATDAMNSLIMRESDAGRKITPNLSPSSLPVGQMPNEVAFLMSASDRFDTPFAFNVRFEKDDAVRVLRAAEVCDAQVYRPDERIISITSPRDMYKIIQALQTMRSRLGDKRAGDIAEAMLGMAGFNWADTIDER